MECAVHSVSGANLPPPLSFRYSSPAPTSHSFASRSSPRFPSRLLHRLRFHGTGRRPLQPLHASQSQIPQSPVRWLLVPVGDGDSKHIGYKVEMPDAFEIVSNQVTVGRLPDKADVVIPVATVSALHARIQKQEERLLITDLDSTNGTFINDRRLKPGVVAAVSTGNYITFGDIHLAMFQVSKLKTVESAASATASKLQESEDPPTSDSETS